MKPHEPKLPFRARPPYILQSMPKLILLAALILLALNFLPPFRHPLLQLYLSSSSSCDVSITPMVSSPSSIIRSSSSSPSSSSSSNVSITPSSMVRSSSSPSSSSSSNFSITPMVSSPPSMSRSSFSSPSSSISSISLSNYSHLSSAQSFFLIQSDSTSSYSSSYPSPPPPSSPPPPPPAQSPPPSLITTSENSKSPTIPKDCDISKGEWVRDTEAPFYTNTTCWTIQEHQNCMKFGRPDTDFLKWRWRPQGCELPRFDPLRFLELVKGKSMAFVGDSLARNHMQSLLCLLSKVEYPKDISDTPTYKSMIYTKYNFTVSIFWSPFLVKSDDEVHQQGSYNLYLDEVDQKWASKMKLYDTIIISGGNWFNRPSVYHRKRRPIGCLYCNRNDIEQLTMQYSNRMAFRTALRAVVGKRYGFKGKVILRALSPSHFEGGDWDKGGDCRRTKPYGSGETTMEEKVRQLYKAQIDELRRVEGEGRKRGIEFRVLDMTGAMLLRPDGHPSRYGHWPNAKVTLYNDCVHWCLPGPVDAWNDFLLHALS